jgi:hypothetical protein
LEPPALRTLIIFSFQGAFARSPLDYSKNLHSYCIKIPKILDIYGARAIGPLKTAPSP